MRDKYLLTSLTRACRLVNDTVKTRLPIQKGLLHILLNQVAELFDKFKPTLSTSLVSIHLQHCLFWSLPSRGTNQGKPHRSWLVMFHIGDNKEKLLFILRSSKTHTKGNKPQSIKIESFGHAGSSNKWCPYKLLQRYLQIRSAYEEDDEPFFVFRDGSAVGTETCTCCFKRIA